jgi:hypothetical protein
MVDRLGKIIRNGDCVRYWHKVNGVPTPEIGEVVSVPKASVPKRYQIVEIERKFYNGTNLSTRASSGITKISKAEGVLWKLEQFATEDME